MKSFYFTLAVVGTLIPWIFFGAFFAENGLNLTLLVMRMFATKPAAGIAVDLLISCAVFWVWSWRDARANGVNGWWLTIPAILLVGLSLGLPLYLWLREKSKELHERTSVA
ncbi:DUF2834 domain-containing protein [Roseibium sp. HPY-6]|uniref:DUF2834 domain-containing protein n=1 Tax=Roseibium sp. HPY-6 TaxID=3229852 RepID=UPI0033902922